MRCSVYECNNDNYYYNNKRTPGMKISFFHFPKDEELRRKWVIFCNRLNPFNTDNATICDGHFKKSDFKRNLQYELLNTPVSKRRIKLIESAVPSIFRVNTRNKLMKGLEPSISRESLTEKQEEFLGNGENMVTPTYKNEIIYFVSPEQEAANSERKIGYNEVNIKKEAQSDLNEHIYEASETHLKSQIGSTGCEDVDPICDEKLNDDESFIKNEVDSELKQDIFDSTAAPLQLQFGHSIFQEEDTDNDEKVTTTEASIKKEVVDLKENIYDSSEAPVDSQLGCSDHQFSSTDQFNAWCKQELEECEEISHP